MYLPLKRKKVASRSMLKELKLAILDLFRGLQLTSIQVESRLQLSPENFSSDFIKAYDEVSGPRDIVVLWHVSESLADNIHCVCMEVLNCFAFEDDEPSSKS